MNAAIAQRLLELNRQFYQTFARPFSATRQRLQPGVRRILESIPLQANILDLGCGNGELWQALYRRGQRGSYIGLDFSPGLLEIAAANEPGSEAQASFIIADLASPVWEAELPTAGYDRILAVAVLHHMPGEGLRRQVLEKVHHLLMPGGLFILSVWQFLNSPRLAARIQPWEHIGLHASQVDPGDYLLDWRHGGSGLRYVHHFSSQELEHLAKSTGFQVTGSFYSDGEDSRLGYYQTWQLSTGDSTEVGPENY